MNSLTLPNLPTPPKAASRTGFYTPADQGKSLCIISDLHLCDEVDALHDGPATAQAFSHYIAQLARDTQCSTLIVLGDLFEVWIGDDAPASHASQAVIDAFQQLRAAGKRVLLMHGNRDFLLSEAFCREASCELIAHDKLIIHYQGHNIALVHGDEQCTDDIAYQQFRHMVREPAWQAEFLRKPLSERQAMARAIRSESEQSKSAQGYTDLNHAAMIAEMQDTLVCPTLIHGHTHEGKSHRVHGLPNWPDAQRHVTSDWDARAKRGDAIWITPRGIERRKVF